jgi:CRISPR/Cas system CSM-associated protein Csm2 small subunit
MKLFLNDRQKGYMLEILKASEVNASRGKDEELASAFNELYKKVEPDNASYINLKRADAESLVDFCLAVVQSLDKAKVFLAEDKDRSEEELVPLKEKTQEAIDEITGIVNQLQEKIRANP